MAGSERNRIARGSIPRRFDSWRMVKCTPHEAKAAGSAAPDTPDVGMTLTEAGGSMNIYKISSFNTLASDIDVICHAIVGPTGTVQKSRAIHEWERESDRPRP